MSGKLTNVSELRHNHYIKTHMDALADNQISQFYTEQVLPFWQRQVQTGFIQGKAEIDIAYAYVLNENPVGSIVVSSGRIECLVKYKELVFNLYEAGFNVFIHDHRGQGLSGRMLENPHKGYVEDFNDYVEDFKAYYDAIVKPNTNTRPFLVCHSMGSAIGALYVQTYREDFAKVVFSAPMFGIQPTFPVWVGRLLVGVHKVLSGSTAYFFGQNDYAPDRFEDNHLTHSEARYGYFRREYDALPQVCLGGITGHWLGQAITAMNAIRENARYFPVPALLLQAGGDKIVANDAQNTIAKLIPDCTFKRFEGAHHELLMEEQRIRIPVMEAILDFLK